MFTFHIGLAFKNDHDVIFSCQLLNKDGFTVADYEARSNRLRVSEIDFPDGELARFVSRAEQEYLNFVKA